MAERVRGARAGAGPSDGERRPGSGARTGFGIALLALAIVCASCARPVVQAQADVDESNPTVQTGPPSSGWSGTTHGSEVASASEPSVFPDAPPSASNRLTARYLPAAVSLYDVELTPPTGPVTVPISLAEAETAVVKQIGTVPPQYKAYLADFSDTSVGTTQSDGSVALRYQQVLVWAFVAKNTWADRTATGGRLGGPNLRTTPTASLAPTTPCISLMMVDAGTGKFLEGTDGCGPGR